MKNSSPAKKNMQSPSKRGASYIMKTCSSPTKQNVQSPSKRGISDLVKTSGSPSKQSCNSPIKMLALDVVKAKDSQAKRSIRSPGKLSMSDLNTCESPSKRNSRSPFKSVTDTKVVSSSPKKFNLSTPVSSADPRTLKEVSTPTKHSAVEDSINSKSVLSPFKRKNHPHSPGKVSASGRYVLSAPSPKKQRGLAPMEVSLEESTDSAITEAQRILRLRLSQVGSPPVIHGYQKERQQLYDLIRRTATTGESNSLLLIGPRGCGKSMLLSHVVDDLLSEQVVRDNMAVVELNGLLQTNDKIALREITRQLKLENAVGDKVFGSFAETLQFLLEALKKGDEGSKSILFVLDEFDLFALHKNQTLLYNLFDVAQSAQAPICVIGVTCRLDVVELLEKRVKSRFSHRQLHLFNKVNIRQYRELCKSYLSLPPDFPDQTFSDQWNQSIQKLLEEVAVKDILDRQFSLTNDVRALLTLLTYPVCQISPSHPTITASDMVTSFKLISTDTKSSMLHGVSILELCLIIAMKHLTDIYEGEPFNFEMVYSEYLKFARRRTGIQIYEKAVVMKAYEHLQTLELIRGQGGAGPGGAAGTQKEYKLMTLLVHPSQILDALQKYSGCPTEIKQWATQSIS